MAKFEVEFEITGLRLKVKAERDEDVSKITQQLGRQLSGMTQPFAGMIESTQVNETQAAPAPEVDREAGAILKSTAKTSRKRIRKNENTGSQPIHWSHDPAAWGTPKQSWKAAQKILWIMYVIGKAVDQTEIGGLTIAETFNKSFKQFGTLNKASMPRDLGGLKTKNPAHVLDNTSVSPITWYLTEAGIQEAERLVAEAREATINNMNAE